MALNEDGQAGKPKLTMQVLHATKTIPKLMPLSTIQQAIDPSHICCKLTPLKCAPP